ncbi:MAG: glycosyltransferase family 4 protein [Actinomycetota bacterium]
MRIGLIAPPWLPVPPPCYGGTEEVIDGLATGLLAAGHDVRLFTTGDSTCQVDKSYAFSRAERTRMGATVPELYHALSAYEALEDREIIHDHTIAGLFAGLRQENARIVTTSHNPFTDELVRIYKAVEDRVAVVAISEDQASRSRDLSVGRVIHHGLDSGAYEFGAEPGGYLLFLGRMSPDKGVHRAVHVARASGRGLVIAAKMQEPLEHQYFEDQVKPMLSDEIVFMGEVDRDGKKQLLANADALINPIDWPEPFGLVMIEALASGTPVVAFSKGSVPEIITDGVNGFVCHDELEMVGALARLGEIDRRRCRLSFEERFSVQRMVRDHIDLYEGMLDSSTTRVPVILTGSN